MLVDHWRIIESLHWRIIGGSLEDPWVLVEEATWSSKQALVKLSLPLLQEKEASLPTNVYWMISQEA